VRVSLQRAIEQPGVVPNVEATVIEAEEVMQSQELSVTGGEVAIHKEVGAEETLAMSLLVPMLMSHSAMEALQVLSMLEMSLWVWDNLSSNHSAERAH
jgi:hypothetical protein